NMSSISAKRLAPDYRQPLVTYNENLLIKAEALFQLGNTGSARHAQPRARGVGDRDSVAFSVDTAADSWPRVTGEHHAGEVHHSVPERRGVERLQAHVPARARTGEWCGVVAWTNAVHEFRASDESERPCGSDAQLERSARVRRLITTHRDFNAQSLDFPDRRNCWNSDNAWPCVRCGAACGPAKPRA